LIQPNKIRQLRLGSHAVWWSSSQAYPAGPPNPLPGQRRLLLSICQPIAAWLQGSLKSSATGFIPPVGVYPNALAATSQIGGNGADPFAATSDSGTYPDPFAASSRITGQRY
jgi:hypothetical protein